MTLCPVCHIEEATIDSILGVLPCKTCKDRQSKVQSPGGVVEFTSDAIKEGRKAYWGDIHGAHRKGVPSKEFRDRYGAAAMKRQGFTDAEIKNAKNVWIGDDTYYGDKNG